MEAKREPDIYIGGKPFYIGFVGVDRETLEEKTPVTAMPDNTNIRGRTDRFMKPFGLRRKESAV